MYIYVPCEEGVKRETIDLSRFEIPSPFLQAIEREIRHIITDNIFVLHITDVSAFCLRQKAYSILDEIKEQIPKEYFSSIVRLLYGRMGHEIIEYSTSPFDIIENNILYNIKTKNRVITLWGRYDLLQTMPIAVNKAGESGFTLWDFKTTVQYSLTKFRSLKLARTNVGKVLIDTDNILYPPYESAIRQITYYAGILRKQKTPVVKAGLFYIARPKYPVIAKPLVQEVERGLAYQFDNIYGFIVDITETTSNEAIDDLTKRAKILERAITENNVEIAPPSEKPEITCKSCPYYSACHFEKKPEKKLP